ncbi:helix-turn-helix transcriptional regulator [Staphylococcus aureus]
MNENVKLLLRAARINNGMSQKKAASLLGVHYQTLASWEKIVLIYHGLKCY